MTTLRSGSVSPLITTVRLLLAGVLMMAGAVLLGLATAAPARAAETAADQYVACLNGSKRGDVLVLIDTSASLQSSDAEAARIAAGEYLLRRLAKSADDAELDLNVSLAGFANRYEPGTGWSALNGGSVDGVLSDIRAFEDRETGQGTDYWLGLDGARRALSERKQESPQSCQSIVFFSDGALDIDRAPDEDNNPIDRPYDPENPLATQADRDRARQAATESLCRPGGLADQTRVVPITLFGVGLTAPGGAQAGDFDLMRRVVEGDCGAQAPNGQFALAGDIDGLLRAFDRITGEGTEQEGSYCQGDQAQLCEEGAHNFVLDASISSVSVLGSGDIDEPRIVLVSPGDRQIELRQSPLGEPQDVELDGVGITYTWMSPKTFSASLDSNDRNDVWTGRWRLIFFDPDGTNPEARSRTSIHISGNVFPAWPEAGDAEVRAGESAEVTFGLVNAAQQPVDPAQLLGTVALDATLIDAAGAETPIARGLGRDELTAPQRLDAATLRPGPASVRLALQVTTAGWTDPRTGEQVPGTPLKPQLVDVPFTVLAPVGFGHIDPSVNFGTAEGPVNLTGALPAYGPGCIWLDPGSPEVLTGPVELTDVALGSSATSAETCVRIEEGQAGELPLTLTSPQTGNGALTGAFTVQMASLDAPDRVQDFTVDYAAEVQRPLNRTNFALALLAALLLGPGIPLALLYLSKWATAKIPAEPLLTETIPVRMQGTTVTRDGAPFALRDGDLRTMAQIPSGGARSVAVGGIVLATRTGASPFGAGDVRVQAGQQVGASSAHPEPVGKEQQARLPLAVHNNWVLLHDPLGAADAATAVLLVAGDSTPAQRQALVEDFNRRAPQVYAGLRSQAGSSAATGQGPGGAPFAGGATSAGSPTNPPSSPPTNPFAGGGASAHGTQAPPSGWPNQGGPERPGPYSQGPGNQPPANPFT